MEAASRFKFLRVALTFVLVFSLCPAVAFADDPVAVDPAADSQEKDSVQQEDGAIISDESQMESIAAKSGNDYAAGAGDISNKPAVNLGKEEQGGSQGAEGFSDFDVKPKAKVASTGDGTVTLEWAAVPGATAYAVAECVGGRYVTATTSLQDTSYTFSDLANGREHAFLVQARVNGKWSAYSAADHVKATPQGTVKPKAKVASTGNESVTLEWAAVPGATKYAVAVKQGSSYKTYTYNCRSTSYTIKGLTNRASYQLLVQANIDGKWSAFSAEDLVEGIPGDVTAPAPIVDSVGDGTVSLSWPAIEGATAYAVAEKVNGKYKTYTLECLDTSYTVSNLSNGKNHAFLVQARVNGKWSGFSDANLVAAAPEGAVKPTLIAQAGERSAELQWDAVSGATKYAIAYKMPNGSYKTLTYECKDTHYIAQNLNGKTEYPFLVQAYIDGKWSSFTGDDLKTVEPTDKNAPVARVSSTGNGKVTLTWDVVPGATAYAVAEYTGGKYKTSTTACAGTTYTVSNLGNGYSHSFLVQAKVNGKWSSTGSGYFVKATPQGTMKPTVKASAGTEKITLSWGKVPGATKYAIAVKNGSGYKTYTTNCTKTSYTVSGLRGGKSYQFLVQAYVCGHWSKFTSSDLVKATPKSVAMPADKKAMYNKAQGYSSGTKYLILVNRKTHKVGVFSGSSGNWSLKYYWSCVTGAPGTPTVTGKFSTTGYKRTSLSTDSRARWCTQIWGGYFFHTILASTNELGNSLSHGCIRLAIPNAQWIYKNVNAGTKVVIYG